MTRMKWAALVATVPTFLLLSGCAKPSVRSGQTAATSSPLPAESARVAPAALSLPQIETTVAGIYERVSPSVVNIRVMKAAPQASPHGPKMPDIPGFPFPFGAPDDDEEQPTPRGKSRPRLSGSGSGFVWDTAGHIVTNNHVAKGADKLSVTFSDGTQATAKLVGTDPDSDLAVIKVDLPKERLPKVEVADSSGVKVGHLAVAIGNPFGLEGTMTVGFISALGRLLPVEPGRANAPGYSIPDVIQTDAPINPGNSGGVLTNSAGQVIGVPSAIISQSGASAGIGFAIPSNIVRKVVPSLIAKGHYEHAWIGISGTTLQPDMAKAMNLDPNLRGALVAEVLQGSPADKAGFRGSDREIDVDGVPVKVGGDIVTAIEGQKVKRFDDIVSWLARSAEVGQTVSLTVLRGGKEAVLKTTLAARPGKGTQTAQASGDPEHPAWLGIGGATLSPEAAKAMGLKPEQKGVLVAQVENGSPADKAGLRGSTKVIEQGGQRQAVGGDVITAVNGKDIASVDDLQAAVRQSKPGQTMELRLLREGKSQTVSLTLGEQPK